MATFTGDPKLLISAAMIQDFIIGKDAEPLAGGTITMTHDNAITVLKDWYQQIGPQGGPYTYVTLPNPMTLTAVGTMADGSGNDIIPFYYPWSSDDPPVFDPYFVSVSSAAGQLQFTRSYFPWVPDHGGGPTPPGTGLNTNENYIINNRFWRNLNRIAASSFPNWPPNSWTNGQYNLDTTVYYQTLAPSQHDGFSMPDFNYIRNTQSSGGNVVETITFNTFPEPLASETNLTGDVGPEFYLNFTCVSDGSSPTLKVFQFPITLHLATLVNEPFSFTIQGRSNSGPAEFNIYIYKFLGTGVESDDPISIGTVTFTEVDFIKQTITGQAFPSTAGDVLGSEGSGGNDDAYYLQIAMPPGAVNVDFTLPSIYLSSTEEELPVNNFQTYDQIDSVIASARTGDVKISINDFYPYGWAPLNDGTIAHPNTATTVVAPTGLALSYQGYDAWALYNLLWNKFHNININGSSLLPIWTAAGGASSYGTNAWSDWNALKQIQLTKVMGQVLLGTVPVSALSTTFRTTFTASSSSGLLITTANTVQAFKGMTVTFSNSGGALPTGLIANTIYYVTADSSFSTTTFHVSLTFALAMAGTAVTFTDAGTGTNTISLYPDSSYEGEYAHTQLLGELAQHTHDPLSPATNFYCLTPDVFAGPFGGGNFTTFPTTGNVTGLTTTASFNVTQPGTFFNMYIKL